MQLFDSFPATATYEVVLNLSHSAQKLYLPTAYIVIRDKVGDLTHLQKKAMKNMLDSYGIPKKPEMLQFLELVELLQVKTLEEKFSPPRRKVIPFAKLMETKEVKPRIEKYVHQKMDSLLQLAVDQGIPLCWEVARKVLVKDIEIIPSQNKLQPLLYFNKTPNGVQYRLTMKEGESIWKINDKDVVPITNNPAWLFVDYKLFKVDGINGNMVKPFQKKEELMIPSSSVKTYFEKFVVKQASKLNIEAEGFNIIAYNELLNCELSILEDFINGTIGIAPKFHYQGTSFHANDNRKKVTLLQFGQDSDEVLLTKIERDPEAEATYYEKLSNLGLTKTDTNYWHFEEQKNRYYLIEWLGKNKNELEALGFQISLLRLGDKEIYSGHARFQQKVSEGNDWFDILIEVQIGEFRFPFHKLVPYIRDNDPFFPLPNGKYFLIPAEWMSRFKGLAQFGQRKGKEMRLVKSQYTILKDLNIDSFKADQKELLESFEPSPNLKATLRPYQLEGVKWLVAHHHNELGACLADDMGLGKTLQTIAVLLHAKDNKEEQQTPSSVKEHQLNFFRPNQDVGFLNPLQALIILPASLVFNWENELRKFAPSLSIYKHRGTKRHKDHQLLERYDVILTTYQTALRDVELLEKLNYEYIVLDESQQIKNKNSKIFKAINRLNAAHKISLSGTPIENSLSDLWSQMEFINPGLLRSFDFFKKQFLLPIEKQNAEEQKDQLRQLVAPFLKRRTKEEVAKDLPDLDVQVFYSEMLPEQQKLYEKEKSKARNFLLEQYTKNSFEYSRIVLQTLLRLRQLANHPKLVKKEFAGGSGKFQDIVEKWNVLRKAGYKTLMFSSFVKHLELFKEQFQVQNQPFSWLTGGSTPNQREKEIERFQADPNISSFLISTKAGGTGLNLTAANYVFMLDPWWNPAAEKQAIARAHRIGQDKKVFAIKFITKDSIEEKILALQARKSALAEDILSGAGKQVFDKGELEFLLG